MNSTIMIMIINPRILNLLVKSKKRLVICLASIDNEFQWLGTSVMEIMVL